jgi:hypothetical protein
MDCITKEQYNRIIDHLSKPIASKEEAEYKLKECGILDENGNITEKYKNILTKTEGHSV